MIVDLLRLAADTEVAKEVADIVLLTDDFSVIVAAVEEGRAILDNIRKVVTYLLSDSFSEIMLISASMLAGFPLPVTAVQILWINLIEDGLPNVALAFEPKEKFLMAQPPRLKKTLIIDGQMKILLSLVGFLGPFFLFLLILSGNKGFLPFHFSQTLVFAALGLISSLVVLSARSLRQAFYYRFWQNPYLIGALLVSLFLLLVAIYWPPLQLLLQTQPLGWSEWFLIIILGVLNLLTLELSKKFLLLKKG